MDGRSWVAHHRGPLWIHAASHEPTAEAIQELEEFHVSIYSALTGDDSVPQLPSGYPVSCLLGVVELVDCVGADEFAAWPFLPPPAREEASLHGSGQLLLFENHQRVILPQRMSGQHKLWKLDHQLAKSLWDGGLAPSAQAPISWVGHREAALAVRNGAIAANAPPADLMTPAMKRNARRSAVRKAKQHETAAAGTAAGSSMGMEPTRNPSPAPAPPPPASATASSTAPLAAHLPPTLRTNAASGAPDGGEALDDWMLAQALALSTAEQDQQVAAALQCAVDVADAADAADADEQLAVAVDSLGLGMHTGDVPRGAMAPLAAPAAPAAPAWAARVAELTCMGFEASRAVEMLEMTDGDVEAAVALLCS